MVIPNPMTTTIAQIATLPDKTGLSELQAKVTNVYKQRPAGDKQVQDIELADGSGNTVKATLWERQEAGFLSGKDVVILAGPQGGLKVKYDNYHKKNALSISAGCSITPVAGGSASSKPSVSGGNINVSQDVEVKVNGAPGQLQPIAGAKVGMALNNAVLLHVNAGGELSIKALSQTASDIIRLSNWLEAGNLVPKAGAKSEAESVTEPAPAPAPKQEKKDEDVPF